MTTSCAPGRPPDGRSYGGRTAHERAEQRRERYVQAGIDLFGTIGYGATTRSALARRTGLAERYFAETFPDLEALLVAVYVTVCGDVVAQVRQAMAGAAPDLRSQVRTGMRVFTEATLADVRRARIQLLEAVGVSEAVEQVRRDTLHVFAGIIADQLRAVAGPGGLDPDLLAMSLVGAVNEVLVDVVLGRVDVAVPQLVEHFVGVALALGAAAGPGAGAPSA